MDDVDRLASSSITDFALFPEGIDHNHQAPDVTGTAPRVTDGKISLPEPRRSERLFAHALRSAAFAQVSREVSRQRPRSSVSQSQQRGFVRPARPRRLCSPDHWAGWLFHHGAPADDRSEQSRLTCSLLKYEARASMALNSSWRRSCGHDRHSIAAPVPAGDEYPPRSAPRWQRLRVSNG